MALTEDHMRLLALAQLALDASTGRLWITSLMEAAERHGAACDALWAELERQIAVQDGKVPTLEHPSVARKELACRMRKDIVSAVQIAVEQILEDMDLSAI